MSEQKEWDEPALHSEVLALKKRIEVLEARVNELERELRETQETAPADY
jgi:cell division protein FtsB